MDRNILVIDDERDMCTLIERVLGKKGLGVKSSTNPMDAIELIKGENFMLLIVDLRMPAMDGIEFIKKAREAGFSNKCIVITAYPSIDVLKEAGKQGVSDILIKPLNILELEDAVARAINNSENREVMGQS